MIYVIHLCVFLFEAFIAWQYQSRLLIKKAYIDQTFFFLVYLSVYAVLLFLFLTINPICVTIAFFIGQCSLGIYLYETNPIQVFLLSAVQTTIMVGSELLVSTWGNYIFQMNNTVQNIITYASYAIGSKILYWILILLLVSCIRNDRVFKPIKGSNKNLLVLCLIPICSLVILLEMVLLLSEIKTTRNQEIMALTCEFMLASINILIFWVYDRHQLMLTDITDLQLRLQAEEADNKYYQMLNQQNEELRVLRHDMKNHLLAIKSYIESGTVQEGEDYIDLLLESKGFSVPKRWCHDSLLNTIIQRNADICTEYKVRFYADIRSHSTDYLQPVDIVAIFGNLLDNAVTAASDCEEGFAEIDCRYDKKKKETRIQVINSCVKPPVSRNNRNWITTKSNKVTHGYGLKSVENAAGKYQGFLKTYYQEDTHTFHVVLILRNITGGES